MREKEKREKREKRIEEDEMRKVRKQEEKNARVGTARGDIATEGSTREGRHSRTTVRRDKGKIRGKQRKESAEE